LPPARRALLDRIGGPRRAGILAVGVLAAALIFGVTRWATAPTWVPAFSGLPLESVGKMTEQLEQAGVEYRMEQGGTTIVVPAADLARARVALAQQGMPAQGRPGLELFDQPSWGMTDFTQRSNYRRALEGELERTIGKMRGVETAQVHLALQDQASFRRAERPSQASVVLKLQSGQAPPQDVVQGIAHLVASSVAGLDAGKVTVLDDAGRLLTESDEGGSLTGLTSHQLKVQREVEGYLERRAEELVSQIVGAGNARVQVAAAINFDKVDRTTESVDPEKQALATEQRSEITPGAQGGAASSNTATSYENTRSTETFSGAIGNVRRITVAVLVNNRALAAPAPADSAKAAAAAALPARTEPRTAEELQRIETLVRSAVGVDSTRGDAVSVVNVPFDGPATAAEVEAEKPTLLETVQTVQKPAITVVGLLLTFAVALLAIRALRPAPATAVAAALPAGGALPAPGAPAERAHEAPGVSFALGAGEPAPVMERAHPKLALAAHNPVRDQAVATVEERPDAALRLMRTWLKEG
jgi:flagellar M-ring protein FliF